MERLIPIALAFLVVAIYANSISGGFVFDSSVLILEDPRLRAFTPGNLRDILAHSYWWPYAETSLYRPLTTFTFLVNYSVLGNATFPTGYHIVNIALHAVNSCLLFALLQRVTRNVWTATGGAALWAVHPLHTEAVANIVGRADLLAATGVLTALVAHENARAAEGRRRTLWTLAVGAASLVAAFSKESGVTAIGLIVLFDVIARLGGRPMLVRSWVAAGVPIALFLLARSAVLGGTTAQPFPFVDNPIISASWIQGRLTALAVAGRYVWLTLWPAHLSADYSYSQIALASGTPSDWAGWALAAALVVAAIVMYRVNRTAFMLIAASAVSFAPVSNLLFPTGTIMGERLAYLPLAFLLPAITVVAFRLLPQALTKSLVPAVLGLVIVACGVRSGARNPVWHSERSLWEATVKTAPNSFKSHSALAEALYDADPTRANLATVIKEKEASLALLDGVPHPEETPEPYRQAAAYYLEYGDQLRAHGASDATNAYRRGTDLVRRYLSLLDIRPLTNSDRTNAELMLSSFQERLQNGTAAVDSAIAALSRDPFNPLAYRTAAAAQLSAQRHDDAATTLMTGFMLTGQPELRGALLDIYKAGLDAEHCAVLPGSDGQLNSGCAIVRRHLCAATIAAASAQRARGRNDLAEQLERSTGGNCR